MPLYEYKCEKCEGEFLELRNMSEREKPIACPDCGGEGKIMFSTFAQGGQSESRCPSAGPACAGST
jgi:putative FmdB family regulatory protein